MNRLPATADLLVLGWMLAAAAGCAADSGVPSSSTSSDAAASAAPAAGPLLPVTLPDLSALEGSVQDQIQKQHSALETRVRDAESADGLGDAFGELGRSLMAAEQYEAAEPALLNARSLAPGDSRWPYYLGHLYKAQGALGRSVTFFQEALERRPDDEAALVWLGEVHLAEGRPEAARPLFAKALSLRPRSLAARFGLGRAALASREYAEAVTHLEAALTLNAQAASVHYPLAMAYRELGETAKAESHLNRRGDFEIVPDDPLMQELKELLQSAIAYEFRGTRALDEGDWTTAAAHFRAGLALAPESPSLRHKLGTSLFMMGQGEAALAEFQRVVRVTPGYAKAHYSLGVLMETSGRQREALDRFIDAVKYDPDYAAARVRLASLLRSGGRLEEALSHYDRALESEPRHAEATFGSAMTLVRLRRYREARDRLDEAVRTYPGEPGFVLSLARLLAAAPDDRVRDGSRATALMQTLPEDQKRRDLGETMAMTLAEAGRFEEAAAWQRRAIAAATEAGQADLARRMAGNLKLYEARRPSRTPWRDEDLP